MDTTGMRRCIDAVTMLTEAKREPVLMYHGTTSRYLRSIITQGIIPDPKQKTWATDKDASIVQQNRTSLLGSYWTSNLMTAQSSAFTSARKFGGNLLIVVAMLSEGSAFADEDSLSIKRSWANLMHDLGVVSDAVRVPANIYYYRCRSDKMDVCQYENDKLDRQREKMVRDFAMHLHRDSDASDRQPIDFALAKDTFEAMLIRQLAYSEQGYYSPLADVATQDRPVLPSPEQADAALLAIQDRLTRRYRQSVYKDNSSWHTLRMPMPIGYSGRNRIIGVVEESTRQHGVEPAKLWYGKLPDDYLMQYRERVGAYPGLVDGRTAQSIIPPDPNK